VLSAFPALAPQHHGAHTVLRPPPLTVTATTKRARAAHGASAASSAGGS
jgi:hypothetical protein